MGFMGGWRRVSDAIPLLFVECVKWSRWIADWWPVQGQRDTWWTGAAFMSHDASVLYNFTQALLPGILG